MIFTFSSSGRRPSAMISAPTGSVILPSGRTMTSPDRSFSFQTLIVSTSFAPMM